MPYKQLKGKDVNKDNFEKIVKKILYKLLVLNGHGTTQAIYGHEQKPIIEEGINQEILTGRITYARACDAALSLGKKAIQSDKEGRFIGDKLPFQFYCNKTWEGNPLKDPIAHLFFETSNTVPIAVIKGKTANEAHLASKRGMLKNIKKY